MFEALSAVMVNPWLFVAGSAAVVLPVLIHLLNRRRFQVVEWAAMDFLLEADKKNRRRIRLENLLLLLLRCLAILLLGLLLARPFVPTGLTAGLADASSFERIVLLDDSLSMQARIGNEAVWDVARARLVDLTRTLAAEKSENSLTLLLTSDPQRPMFNADRLNLETAEELIGDIEKLAPSHAAANLEAALQQLAERLDTSPANANRVAYILSDLRSRDWKTGEASPASPLPALKHIAGLCSGCFVLDVGTDDIGNLTVDEVRAERTLVADVPARFDVTVANRGTVAADDVSVQFTVGNSLAQTVEIERIAPGATATALFTFTFAAEQLPSTAEDSQPLSPRQVKIELQVPERGAGDRLLADSVAYYPARLVRGIPTLVVDGDPSAAFGKSESYYVKRSLAPTGPTRSGVVVEVVTESEFDGIDLDGYQVVFLCNVYRLGEKTQETIERLERWVAAGGGLAIFPGDQVDEHFFNAQFFRGGQGLSPLKLENIRGDEMEETWAQLQVVAANHPLLRIFAGQSNPFLDRVKLFRWWVSSTSSAREGVSVLARLNDDGNSPLLAERSLGNGRVIAMSVPADADWTNWPGDPSFVIVMQELVRYLAVDQAGAGLLRVGEPIRQAVDLARYQVDVGLTGPQSLATQLQAAPPTTSKGQAVWQVGFDQTQGPGFYELSLTAREGVAESILFAVNVDPSEGDLRRVDRNAMRRGLVGANVQIVPATNADALTTLGTQTELSWHLLWIVAGVLFCEQALGWFFGRAR